MSSNSCYSKIVFEICTVKIQKLKFTDICYFDTIGYYYQNKLFIEITGLHKL